MLLEALQTAVFNRLRSSDELDAVLARNAVIPGRPAIYDHVPQVVDPENDDHFPYIVMDLDPLGWDTDTELGFSVEVILHAYTRHGGNRVVRKIQDLCYNILHRKESSLVVSGGEVILINFESAPTAPLDGRTYRGVQIFTVFVEGME